MNSLEQSIDQSIIKQVTSIPFQWLLENTNTKVFGCYYLWWLVFCAAADDGG